MYANEEDPVGDLVGGTAIGGVEAGDLALHAAPSLLGGIAVELAEQGIAVFLGPVRQVRDEGFYLFTGSIAKRLDAAEVCRIRLDQVGIELMLTDDLAESIANGATMPFPFVGCGGNFFDSGDGWGRFGDGPDFFDRADADPVGLAQGTIHRARFGDSHLGTVDERTRH